MLATQTGWPEEFIFWQLPLQRVWAYVLCYCRSNGVKCRWGRGVKSDHQVETDLRALVGLLK